MTIRLARNPKSHRRIATRAELAAVLGATVDQIAEFVASPPSHYGYFRVPKPDGDFREIRPPKKRLRAVQRMLLEQLYKRLRIPSYLHGGVPGRSIITHAKCHVGMEMVGTLDVKSFFPSTSVLAVTPVLAEAGFTDGALSDVIAMSMLDGGLPQGITSKLPAGKPCLLRCGSTD
jgi:RNA-directed DNA polymerase